MRLAKWSSCQAISCSWAATRLASIVVLLISFAFCFNFLLFLSTLFLFPQFRFFLSFCFNFSSFSFNWFSFSSSSFFLSSISIAARQFRSPSLLPGIAVKVSNPLIIICLLLLTFLTPVYTINKIWWAYPLKQKHPISTKSLKPCLIRSSEGNQGNRSARGGKAKMYK